MALNICILVIAVGIMRQIKRRGYRLIGVTAFSLALCVFGCGGGGGNATSSVPSNPVSPSPNPGNSVTLTWDAPTTNIDGSPLTDLAGYKIYYGTSTGVYSNVLDVKNVTTYNITGLSPGTYYFTLTAYNTSKQESDYTKEISKQSQ